MQPRGVTEAAVVSLAVTGNTSLSALGDGTQLSALATLADGSTQDVTGKARWEPSGSFDPVITISAGLVKAVAYGRSHVYVNYAGLDASSTISVLPPGTYLLEGVVTESGFTVETAHVEVTFPSGMQYTTTTNRDGKYQLPAAGAVTLRVDKQGYDAAIQQLEVGSDAQANVDLRRSAAPGDVQGVYQLTMIASPSCTALPPEATRRSYVARIRAISTGLVIEVTGANMVAFGDAGFTGVQENDGLRFDISDNFIDDYVFVERLSSGKDLSYSGVARGSSDGSRVLATFNGRMQIGGFGTAIIATCSAADHHMEFVRE